jgi:putative acetyltransferase
VSDPEHDPTELEAEVIHSERDPAEVEVALEHADQPQVRRLIEDLDAYLSALYPAGSVYRLSVEELCRPDVRFFVARRGHDLLGCAALRPLSPGVAELKRMYVDPQARGLGLGRRLLAAIEQDACALGVRSLLLETGVRQPEALALYRSAGFRECGPFADYGPDPLSVFMQKDLPGRA